MESPREFLEGIIARTKSCRKDAGFTQETIAEFLNIPRNTYAHYERAGEERVTILPVHLVARFCDAVGVSVRYLLTGEENEIVAAYKRLQGNDKAIVDKFLGFDDGHANPTLEPQPSRYRVKDTSHL